jgi:integrase
VRGREMTRANSYLARHGNVWRVQVAVPVAVQGIIGAKVLFASTRTDSLSLATVRKHALIHTLKSRIEAAKRQLKGQGRIDNPLLAEAAEWRNALAGEASSYLGEPIAIGDIEGAFFARMEEVIEKDGAAAARTLASIAHGATPIMPFADDWLALKVTLKPRQRLDYRRAVSKFEAWLLSKALEPTVGAVTKRVASDYRDSFVRAGVHPKTASKDISVLSGLWKEAERKSLAEDNPWRGQSFPKQGAPGSARKRPPTDDELSSILAAAPEGTLLGDAIRLLALGGMRCEELARMRVGDLQDLDTSLPWVDLKGSKTEAARRSLPLHSQALSIYRRRAEGKAPDAYLLDELRTPPEGSAMERGQPITKLYSRLLAHLKIGEKEDGARQGNVDLHSLRRRWVTQAEQAGHPENLIASCVGHQRPGMTFGRYSSGPLLEQLRVVVESVKLPT